MMRKAMTVLVLLVVMITVVPASPTKAEMTADELRQERLQLQQQLDEINRELAAIKGDVAKAQQRAATLKARREITLRQIEIQKEIIQVKTNEVATLQEDLDAKQRERDATYELFRQRMRAMYMNNNTSTLSALLGASSFSDFLVRAETLSRISRHDTQLIEKLTEEELALAAGLEVMEQELKALEDEKAELDVMHNELALLIQEANAEINAAEALKQATEEQRLAALAEIERNNEEWNQLMRNGQAEAIGDGIYWWPLESKYTYISSPYGWRYIFGKNSFHYGMDVAGGDIYGSPVFATDAGRVSSAVYGTTGYGYYVIVDHGNNNWSVYAHMSGIKVKVGDYVMPHDVLGYVGSTGNSTGPHLHFEIRLNGTAVDPYPLVQGNRW